MLRARFRMSGTAREICAWLIHASNGIASCGTKPHKHPYNLLLTDQSSSNSRLTAGASGFFDLIQCGERPEL